MYIYASSDTICYDNGCHLKKYACKRADLTETSKKIASYNIVIDKMHFKGHTDEWCHANCNPYELEHLHTVSAIIVLQVAKLVLTIKQTYTLCMQNYFNKFFLTCIVLNDFCTPTS